MDNLEVYVNISVEEFPLICRICLAKGKLKCFKESLVTIFTNLTDIQIEPGDNLPSNICPDCTSKLEDISKFINLSKLNDAGLRRILEIKEQTPSEECEESVDNDVFNDDLDFPVRDMKLEDQSVDSDENSINKSTLFSDLSDKIEEEVSSETKKINGKKRSLTSAPEKFHCFHCQKTFPTKNKLKVHLIAHSEEGQFECKLCNKKFKFSQNLVRHNNSAHKNLKPFKCEICHKEFSKPSSREEHKCGISGNSSSPIDFPEIPDIAASEDGEICKMEASTETNLETPSNPLSKRPECQVCHKTFSKKYHLENHELIHTGEKPFECKQCGKFFRLKSTLNTHLKSHSGEKPYTCTICHKKFAYRASLRDHEKYTHMEGAGVDTRVREKCNLCERVLSSKKTLAAHMAAHYKRFHCHICGNSYAMKNKLDDHLETHNGVEFYQCNICNKKKSSKSALSQHLYLHSKLENKQYQCEVCEKTFSKKFHLENHFRVHSGEKPFECEYCKKTFRVKNSYRLHVRIHTGNKPYQCNFCDKRFAQVIHWRYHEETHTLGKVSSPPESGTGVDEGDFEPKEGKTGDVIDGVFIKGEENEDETDLQEPEFVDIKTEPNLELKFARRERKVRHLRTHTVKSESRICYCCKDCQKTFNRRMEYRQHMEIHHAQNEETRDANDAGVKCHVCEKTFVSKYVLQTHMITHNGKKEFLCNICGKEFLKKVYLDIHAKIHTDEKPFECKVCGKRFRQSSTYKTHLVIHTGERFYKCNQCDKTFKQNNHLKRHHMIHEGIKPHECSFCGKSFVQLGNLKSHMRLHTGETPYPCSICGKKFSNSGNLKKHKKSHGIMKIVEVESKVRNYNL